MSQIIWSPGVTLEQIEKQVILKAFSFFDCNKTRTADALGIAVRTLDAKLEKYKGVAFVAEQPIKVERTEAEVYGSIQPMSPQHFVEKHSAKQVVAAPKQVHNKKR